MVPLCPPCCSAPCVSTHCAPRVHRCSRCPALIYFVIADLASIDPMYQYSLSFFARLYNTCIDDAEKSSNLDKRLASLIDYLTSFVYKNVCRGLFEAHKLLFSFLISISILRNEGAVSTVEWLTLLRGAGLATNSKRNPFPDTVPELSWNLLYALEVRAACLWYAAVAAPATPRARVSLARAFPSFLHLDLAPGWPHDPLSPPPSPPRARAPACSPPCRRLSLAWWTTCCTTRARGSRGRSCPSRSRARCPRPGATPSTACRRCWC